MKEYLNKAIEQLIQCFPQKPDAIYLMGRINHLCMIKEILGKIGYRVVGILDNDAKKQNLYVDGIKISDPDDILCEYNPNIAIIIYSPKYSTEMVKQCESFGYKENKNVFIVDKPTEQRNIQLVKLGIRKYNELVEKYGDGVKIFFLDCPRGDFYLLMLFFREYCKKNNINEYVFISHSQGLKELSELFNAGRFEPISVLESRALTTAWRFLGGDEIALIPLTLWQGDFRFNSCLTRQRGKFTFIDTFRCMIFGLGESAEPEFLDFTDYEFDVDSYAKKKGLKKGESVIISPFSYSLQSLPNEIWISIAEQLRCKGYIVAVNIGHNEEKNFIPNTISVDLDFSKMIRLMEYAGNVIGMRSGFFDITSKAVCKRIVLYPKASGSKPIWNSTDMSFCSLRNMQLCSDAHEIEVYEPSSVSKRIAALI